MTPLTERDFDKLLETAVEELPDGIAAEITPWRRAMGNIIGGSGLCAVTVNLLRLNILLPATGVILQLLGFRSLRRENGWFRACWILSLLRAALYLPELVLNATIYHERFYLSGVGEALAFATLAGQLLLFFCLWPGLRAAQKRAGLPPRASSAGALFAWYMGVAVLALAQYSGWPGFIFMLVCYVCILRSLFRLSQEMEEQGYALRPAGVRISDQTLVRGILIVLACGIACGYLFFGRYPMDWSPASETEDAPEVRAALLALGYPEAALRDLSGEDLLACRGALRVVAQERDEPVNRGREVRQSAGNTVQITTAYDVKELHLTDVAVELPGGRWKLFHHFLWTVNPGFPGTECLQLWPAYRDSDGWCAWGEPTGRVLYDAGGRTYTAPFASLATEGYTAQSVFWGDRYVKDLFATFSLPSRGENQRGYISYGVETVQEGYLINAWVNYTHQESRLQYPVLTARENRRQSGWNESFPFFTVQNALQFFPAEETG